MAFILLNRADTTTNVGVNTEEVVYVLVSDQTKATRINFKQGTYVDVKGSVDDIMAAIIKAK